MTIRPARAADADAVWRIFRAVVAGADTYLFPPDTTRAEAVEYFMGIDADGRDTGPDRLQTYVAEADGAVVGMYKLIPNRPGLGSHVANASFMVDPPAQGRGVGRAMGEHSLAQARLAGYRAMQFNFVVSTNSAGVELWKKLGFTIVGTLPQAFRHASLGLVDAYVMHRFL